MLETARNLSEKLFRQAAMYVFAVNQSRAKVLTDPIYLLVAKRLLPADLPLHPRLAKEKIPDNLYLAYRAQSRRLQYFIEDWDFNEARPELLTPRQRQMMHTVALGETSGAAVSDGFLRAFRYHPELAAFFGTWFTEELNHFIGYHAYLERMGQRWPVQRGLDVAAVDFIPYAEDPMEVATCNMYQELLGFVVYRSISRQVKDPFLSRMLAQFAKDECRHYKFYQQVVARQIQRDPAFRAVVLKVFLKATSPYNQVSGGARNTLDHLQMGAFYFRKPEYEYLLGQLEYLLGTPLRSFFDWYFKDVVAPCTRCARQLVQCDCTDYEDREAPEIRNPDWWKQTSRSDAETGLNIEAWTRELLERAQKAGGPARRTA